MRDEEIFKRFINGEELSKEDKFLRKYILSQAWKSKADQDDSDLDGGVDPLQKELMRDMEKLDDVDAQAEEQADDHENKYNFRYEDKTGAYLTTYAREAPEESMRRKDDKRKDERERKKERKEEEKRKRKEELEQLKRMKREEIKEKLQQAKFLSGSDKIVAKLEKELGTEFIPDVYDKAMVQVFDDQYYESEGEDDGEDEEKVVNNRKLNL